MARIPVKKPPTWKKQVVDTAGVFGVKRLLMNPGKLNAE